MGKIKGKLTRREISKRDGDIYYHEITKNKPKISEETQYRQEINADIIKMVSEGKGKVEILIFLNNKYENSKFSKFFEQWIEHHVKSQEISRKRPFSDFCR